jgi:hypothetical protein
MSKIEVDAIEPQSGTSLTLGASGDTITIPSGATLTNSGTATGFGGTNTPAFSVYRNGNQSISSSTWTKVEFNTVNFDTDSDYDNVTNYRFTPQVAGKYQFNININFDGTSVTFCAIRIYKNGSSAFTTFHINNTNTGIRGGGSVILEANGTTDYFEGYAYLTASSPIIASGIDSVFSGFKIIE